MVDLELYRIFKIVAEEENITIASKKLNISQPAVTKHIQNLEAILNIKLFERTNRGLKLTDGGRKIYDEINMPIRVLENIYNKYLSTRIINLGIHSTMLNKLFSKILTKFYSKYEHTKINIVNNDIKEMLSKLEKEELDIVISKKTEEYDKEKLDFICLGKLQDILITSNSSSLQYKDISIEELKEKVLYMPRTTSITSLNFFKSLNIKIEDCKNIKNISYNTMIEIIKNSGDIGLATKQYIQKELDNKEIVELNAGFNILPIEYGIYINKENTFKELNELIEVIKN